jgi:CTP:molybdopterin cytidylyltransferase MocA
VTAAAVLAAGRGSRLAGPTPKPLLLLRGRPLVQWALDAAVRGGAEPVLLVVGRDARAVAATAPAGVVVVRARSWRRGIAHSLRAALRALQATAVDAVSVGLADQPLVGADAYRRLAAAHADGARLAVATYAGQRGNPVLLDRAVWPAADRLRGDVGARALMGRYEVTEVDCTGTGDPVDVDTLDDLRALEGRTA